MTGVGVIDIYDTIKRSGGEYCGICFQPATARKLVNPVFLKQFQDAMGAGQQFQVSKQSQTKVCYMCEALAARAVRFLWAVQLAAVIEKLCVQIVTDNNRHIVFRYISGAESLGSKMPSQSSASCLQAKMCEDSLHRMPRALYQTDTLVISSDKIVTSHQPTQIFAASPAKHTQTQNSMTPTPRVMNTQNLPPIPKLVHAQSMRSRNQPSNIPPLELLITEPPQAVPTYTTIPVMSIKAKKRNIKRINAPIPEPALRVLKSLGNVVLLDITSADRPCAPRGLALKMMCPKSGDTMMHLVEKGKDGNVYVPSLKLQISDKGMLKSVSDQHLAAFPTEPILEEPPKKRAKSPESPVCVISGVTNGSGDYNDFVNKQYAAKNNTEQNIVLNFNDLSEPIIEVNDVVINIDDFNEAITVKDKSNAKNASVSNTNENGVENKMAPQPVPRMDRVDWEDKIPMDVISFMDATDPNPSERIMQPNPPPNMGDMGVISDVRSVDDADVTIIDYVECIDLC